MVPVVLAVVASLTSRGGTEHELADRTRTALASAGVEEADVSFDGVVGTVVVRLRALPDQMSSQQVQDIVDGVRGARSVTVRIPRRPGLTARAGKRSAPTEGTAAPTGSDSASPDQCTTPQAQVDALLGPDKVAFGNNGAELPADQVAEVEAVAAYLVRCRVAVDVTGHTAARAPSGTRVGIERARAVAAVLRAQGALVVRVQGRRGTQPLGDDDTQAGRKLNRYADVVAR